MLVSELRLIHHLNHKELPDAAKSEYFEDLPKTQQKILHGKGLTMKCAKLYHTHGFTLLAAQRSLYKLDVLSKSLTEYLLILFASTTPSVFYLHIVIRLMKVGF